MATLKTLIHTRRRLLSWLGGLLLVYALLGFFVLPWLVESQLEKILQERLSVTTNLERVYFNPFSFNFNVEQLELADPGQGSLLKLGRLQVDFQASRLVLLKLQFAEIIISDLDIYYTRSSVDDDTVSRLAERWANTAQALTNSTAVSSESAGLIPLEILSLTLSDIQTHIVDEVPLTPFSTTLSLAQAQINGFSTLPDQAGDNELSINFEQGARLNWSGGFTVNPLDFQGEIALSNFSLLPVGRYLQDDLPFQLDEGHINLSLYYNIDLSQAQPRILVDRINLDVNDFSATQLGEAAPFALASRLALYDGQVSIPQNRAEFASLSLEGIELNAIRSEAGLINIQEMVDALLPVTDATVQAPEEASAQPVDPWFFSLADVSIENNRFSFVDNSIATPFSIVTSIDAGITGIDNQAMTRFPLSAKLSLDSGGTIELDGELQVLPTVEFSSAINLADIAINVAQPYVDEFAFLDLLSGSLALDANLAVNPDQPFSLRGGAELTNVEILDRQLNETLFSMSGLGIDTMSLSLADNSIDISEITLQDFFARVLINEDGSSNIGGSLKAGELTPDPETTLTENTNTGSPLEVIVGQINLQNASANFTDRNLPLPFSANIQNLTGTVQGFASSSNLATEIHLEGQVDEFGLVQIDSSLNPFNFTTQSQIDVNFSNIDMPSMTPYVIKFAGREIAEGKVDLELSYKLLNGVMNANNQLVLSALRLGDRIEQAGAMDLPLDLAVALLKDGNGVIDLEVPISGDVNDPEFNFGPAIRRAITNILTNLVAAPFRLLGNLIGGDDGASLDHIRFLPGRSDIAAPEQEILLKLSEALKQRPQLLLEIASVTAPPDELALKTLAVDADIETELQAQPASDDSLTTRRLAAVESLYAATALQETLEQIRLLYTPQPDTASDDASTQPAESGQLDTLAYIADLRERLIEEKPVSNSELIALGASRRNRVVEFLSSRGGISAPRLLEVDALVGAVDEDGWLVLPFSLTAQ